MDAREETREEQGTPSSLLLPQIPSQCAPINFISLYKEIYGHQRRYHHLFLLFIIIHCMVADMSLNERFF